MFTPDFLLAKFQNKAVILYCEDNFQTPLLTILRCGYLIYKTYYNPH